MRGGERGEGERKMRSDFVSLLGADFKAAEHFFIYKSKSLFNFLYSVVVEKWGEGRWS